MSRKESSWRGVVDMPDANQLLKYKPEAVPNLNSYDNMCARILFPVCAKFRKNEDDLAHTTYK